MRDTRRARAPRFRALLWPSGRDLGREVRFRRVVSVRVVRVREPKRARFGGQEPSPALISNVHVRTTKPRNLDFGPRSVCATYKVKVHDQNWSETWIICVSLT